MEKKTYILGSLIISIMIISTKPTLATKNDDEPLIHYDDIREAASPMSKEYDDDILKKVSPEDTYYIRGCWQKKIGHDCTVEMMDGILVNRDVSKDCCRKILSGGKDCQMAIANLFFKFYHLKQFASRSVSKANKVWNKCLAQIVTPSPFSG